MSYAAQKRLADEISTVLADARYEWSHSSHARSLSVEDFMVRFLTRFIQSKLGDKPQPEAPKGMKIWAGGKPAPWGMGKSVGRGRRLKPQRLADWQALIGWEWRKLHGTTCFEGPVEIECLFHVTRPHLDLDNLLKAAIDGLKDIAFRDDDRVYKVTATKLPPPEEPCEKFEPGMELALSCYRGPAFDSHIPS